MRIKGIACPAARKKPQVAEELIMTATAETRENTKAQLGLTWDGELPPREKIPDVEQQALEMIRELLEGPDHVSPEDVKVEVEKTTTTTVKGSVSWGSKPK
ncbi:hypothetical protein [Streptomyces sp. NPDC056240]|uniref:hypothetical protein n=1 Tax=Streptomyces sp. NPDC056240 TaxID=3345759 RepID=UPI0035D5F8AE